MPFRDTIRILLAPVAVGIILVTAPNAFAEHKLKIAAVLPLTGDYAAFGSDIQRGLEAYQAQHPEKVSIVYEDGGTLDPARCVRIVQKVIDQNRVDAIVVVSADDAQPVGPLVTQRKVPLVIIWDSHHDILASSPYIFSSGFDTRSAGSKLAEHAVKSGRTKAALVSDPSPYTELTAGAFIQKFTDGKGGTIVLDERMASFDADLRSVIPRIIASKADVVYANLATISGLTAFLRRLKEQGYEGMVVSNELLAGEVIAGAANIPLREGIFVTWVHSPFLDTIKQYFGKKGIRPQVDFSVAAVGYDSIEAVARARQESPSDLLQGLLRVFGGDKTLGRGFAIKAASELTAK